MPTEAWLTAAAAAAFLALALLSGVRRSKSPLAQHVGLMSVGLFAYNMTEVLSFADGARTWVYLGDAAATLTAIATLELFLGFVGKSRALAKTRIAGRVYFGLLSLACLGPLLRPSLASFHDAGIWAVLMLIGVVPGFGLVTALLVSHLRRSRGAERARSQLLAGALLLGVGGITTDLVAMAGANLPRLSYFGLLASAVLVAAVTLKARIVEGATSAAIVTLVVIGVTAVVALLVVYSLAGDRLVLFVFGALVIVLVMVAAIRPLVATVSEERSRARYVTTLGRFTSQMAHDIRNPLAAIRGAAQFLKEEHVQGRPLEPHIEFIDMIVERTDRIERLVQDYRRMGRLELALSPVDANALVTDALRAHSLDHSKKDLRVETSLEPDLPMLSLDRDLLTFAVENLLRNATEAMQGAGVLTVRTSLVKDARGAMPAPIVQIAIRDTGPGMDVRTRERALEGFFTTKEGGTGLGLQFVARVAEAHHGELVIESEEGQGTEVVIALPAQSAPPSAKRPRLD